MTAQQPKRRGPPILSPDGEPMTGWTMRMSEQDKADAKLVGPEAIRRFVRRAAAKMRRAQGAEPK